MTLMSTMYRDIEEEEQSPTDTSEDSIEVQVSTKRTSLSPMCLAPKKRFKLDALRELEQMNSEVKPEKSETEKEANKSPFRPWSREGSVGENSKSSTAASAQSGVSGVPYIPFLLPGLRHPPILPLYPYLPPYLALPPKSDV